MPNRRVDLGRCNCETVAPLSRHGRVCEFNLKGETFIIEEPFGDNSRFWVGTKNKPQPAVLAAVRQAFERPNTLGAPMRLVVAVLTMAVVWLGYQQVGAVASQDRGLDAGGRWNSAELSCAKTAK